MHEIASSFAAFFLSPFNWIVILIVAGFLLKKPTARRICRVIALCIFLLFGNRAILNWYARKWQPWPVTFKAGTSYSCGIVLGGFGSPGADGNGHFNEHCDRFIQIAKLYKLGNIMHILISGGNGKNDDKSFREGAFVKGELKAMGVPDSVIFIEDRSNNTADNSVFSKHILDSIHLPPPYVLVTSAEHIPRATVLFKKAGIPTIAFPCNYGEGLDGGGFPDLMPRLYVLLDWNGYLKEAAGYLIYSVKGK